MGATVSMNFVGKRKVRTLRKSPPPGYPGSPGRNLVTILTELYRLHITSTYSNDCFGGDKHFKTEIELPRAPMGQEVRYLTEYLCREGTCYVQ